MLEETNWPLASDWAVDRKLAVIFWGKTFSQAKQQQAIARGRLHELNIDGGVADIDLRLEFRITLRNRRSVYCKSRLMSP
jgi:hypothetical protein